MSRALRIACVALGIATALPAQQVTARIGGELTAPSYAYFRIPITVDMTAAAGATLGSYTARLTWNPAALSYYNYVSGGDQDTSAQGNFPPPAVNADSASQGVLKFSAVSPAGAGGLVTIAQFEFYVSYDTLPSPVGLSFSEMSAAGSPFTNLLPILTVQGATFCRSLGKWGDLDRDGASNSRDALIVLSKVVGLAINPLLADTAVADVDADGRTTSRDALVILSASVGMPVTGQRVLLPVAGGGCGTGSAQQVAIQPGTIDLAVGQPFRMLAQASDSAGRPVTLPQVTWRSSDYAVAGVDAATGLVAPRAPGTATITAEVGPGVTATATVTVVARRPNWYVDIAATGRAVQNGTMAMPFESPLQAFGVVTEGDTIRVAPGTYFWPDADGWLDRGVVIQGGTPGDTTTRPVFRGPDDYVGLNLRGGFRTEVRNVVIQGFDEGIDLDGVRNLILEDVKFVPGQYGMDGVYACPDASLDTIRVDRTHFIGDPLAQSRGDAIYISGCTNLDVKVMVIRDSRIEHFADALYLYGVDSLQVLRTTIRDNRGDGIYIAQEYNETPAVHVAHSRIERNAYGGITVNEARRIVIDTSVIRADSSNALELEHDNGLRGNTYLRGDSVYHGTPYYYNYWLSVYDTDSLVVDDLVLRAPDDTSTDVNSYVAADVAVVRRSQFLNLGGSSTAFSFYGRRLFADSVTMAGCTASGCHAGRGFYVNAVGLQPWAQVLRSSFTQMYSAVNAYGAGTPAVLEVRGVTLDSIYDGIYASQIDSADISGNTITRAAYTPVQVWSGSATRPSRVAGNNITCTGTYQTGVTPSGMMVYYTRAVVEHDTVTGCRRGIETSGLRPGSRIRQNTLRNNPYGIHFYQADTVLVRVDSNGVSGADTAAVFVYYASASLTHNRLENNAGDGLYVFNSQGFVTQAHDNAFVNNAGWAVFTFFGDSVDASANWWDLPGTGAPPGTSPPNGVNSGRINTTSPLAAPPANLPGLAPPVPMPAPASSSARAATADGLPPTAAPAPEAGALRRERERQARLEAKAAKDARHAARRNSTTATP